MQLVFLPLLAVVSSIVNFPIAITLWAPRKMVRLLSRSEEGVSDFSRTKIKSTRLQQPLPVIEQNSLRLEESPSSSKYADYVAVLEAQRASGAVVDRMKNSKPTAAQRLVAERSTARAFSTPTPQKQHETSKAEALVQQKTKAEREARAAAEAARSRAMRAAEEAAAAVAAASEEIPSNDGEYPLRDDEELKNGGVVAALPQGKAFVVDEASAVRSSRMEDIKAEARAEAWAEMEAAVASAKAEAKETEAVAHALAEQAQTDAAQKLAAAAASAKAEKESAVEAAVAEAAASATTAEDTAAQIAADLEKAQVELRAVVDSAAAFEDRKPRRQAAEPETSTQASPASPSSSSSARAEAKPAPSFVAVDVVEHPKATTAAPSSTTEAKSTSTASSSSSSSSSGHTHEGQTRPYEVTAKKQPSSPSSEARRSSDRFPSSSRSSGDRSSAFGNGGPGSVAAEVQQHHAKRRERSPVAQEDFYAQRQQEARDLQAYHEACNARLAAIMGGKPPPSPPVPPPPQEPTPQQASFNYRRQNSEAYNRYSQANGRVPPQQTWQPPQQPPPQQEQWVRPGRSAERQQQWQQPPQAPPPPPPRADRSHFRPPLQQQPERQYSPAAHQWRARPGRYTGPPPVLSPEARLAMEGFGPDGYLAPQEGFKAAYWDDGIDLQAELDNAKTLSPLAFNIMHHYKGQPAA